MSAHARLELGLANLGTIAVIAAAVAVTAALLHLLERTTGRIVSHRLGWRGVLFTGWLGVPIHELGHLAMALLFGHRIIAWKLFDPDPASGTLGYVRHARSREGLWQRLGDVFIAVAPLGSGAAALAAALLWMAPAAELQRALSGAWPGPESAAWPEALTAGLADVPAAAAALGGVIWRHRSALLPLKLYLGACVACHMAPSRADFASAAPALLVAVLLATVTAAVTALAGVSLHGGLAALPCAAVLLACATPFQVGYAAIVALAARASRSPARRPIRQRT